MTQFRNSKGFYVLLSVFMATMLWMYVRQSIDPAQDGVIRNIPVVISGEHVLEDQGMTIKSIAAETVTLKVNAPLSALERMRGNQAMSVTVDVSKYSVPGEYSLNYTINYPSGVSPDDVLLNERIPAKIGVNIDKLNSATFTIQPRLEGSVAEGYQAGKWSISQDTVTVSGSAEQVGRVSKVEAVLTGENLTQRTAGDVPLRLLDKDGMVLTDLDVKLSIDTVYVSLPVVIVKSIPLTVNYISGGGVDAANRKVYTAVVSPESITVSGEEDDILDLTEISLGSIDLSKVIGTSSFTFPVELDPRLENVSGIDQAVVTVTINNLSTKVFDVENISLINVPDGRSATATTRVCNIVIRGQEEELEKIAVSQIRVVADLSDLTSVGSFTVPVKVYLNASQSVGVIGDYYIAVNVT